MTTRQTLLELFHGHPHSSFSPFSLLNQHQMKHVAAYLMLVLGGNASPTADDVTKALESVGIEGKKPLDHCVTY